MLSLDGKFELALVCLIVIVADFQFKLLFTDGMLQVNSELIFLAPCLQDINLPC